MYLLKIFLLISFNAQITSAQTKDFLMGSVFFNKPELEKRISDERWIAVSSKFDENSKTWFFLGEGQVKLSLDKTWKAVREFDRLAHLKDVFKTVQYDKERKKLALTIKLLALEKSFVLKFQEVESLNRKELYFQVENGFMKLLSGVIRVESISASISDVGLKAYYNHEVEWPSWLFAFATEAVVQHVAADLRLMIEKGE